YVNANRVYEHDPLARNQTPFSLFPPMEWHVDTGWHVVPNRPAQPQLLDAPLAPAAGKPAVGLTEAALQPLIDEAIARWVSVVDAGMLHDRLARTHFEVADLTGTFLGLASRQAGPAW